MGEKHVNLVGEKWRNKSQSPSVIASLLSMADAQSLTHAGLETNMATANTNILCLNFNEDHGRDGFWTVVVYTIKHFIPLR